MFNLDTNYTVIKSIFKFSSPEPQTIDFQHKINFKHALRTFKLTDMKKLIFLLILFTSCTLALAQGGWEKVIETNSDGRAFDFLEAPNGDILVAYNLDQNQTPATVNSDIFLTWLDQDGRELDQIELPNTGYFSRRGTDLLATEDGHFIIIATTIVDLSENPLVTALKINAQGDILWEQNLGPDNIRFDTNRGFVNADGNIYIAGSSIVGLSTFFSIPFLMKLDEAGNLIWLKNPISNSASAWVNDVVATDDEIYLLINLNAPSILISKVDFDGNLIVETEHSEGDVGHSLDDPRMDVTPDGEIGIYVKHSFNLFGCLLYTSDAADE